MTFLMSVYTHTLQKLSYQTEHVSNQYIAAILNFVSNPKTCAAIFELHGLTQAAAGSQIVKASGSCRLDSIY
jgi:hypothetical protein